MKKIIIFLLLGAFFPKSEAQCNSTIWNLREQLTKLQYILDNILTIEYRPYEKPLQMVFEFKNITDFVRNKCGLQSIDDMHLYANYQKQLFKILNENRKLRHIKRLVYSDNLTISNARQNHYMCAIYGPNVTDTSPVQTIRGRRKIYLGNEWLLEPYNITNMEFLIRNAHCGKYLIANYARDGSKVVYTIKNYKKDLKIQEKCIWKLTTLNDNLDLFMIKSMYFNWPNRHVLYTKATDTWRLPNRFNKDLYLSNYFNIHEKGDHWTIE